MQSVPETSIAFREDVVRGLASGEQKLFTIRQLSRNLGGKSRQWFYAMIEKHRIPVLRAGRTLLVREQDVAKFLLG